MSQSSIQCLAAVDGHRVGVRRRCDWHRTTCRPHWADANQFRTARQRRYARLPRLAQLQRLHSLANAVLQEIDMPDIDVASTGIAPGRTEAKQSIFAGQHKLRGYQPDHPVEMAEPDNSLQKLRSAGTCSRFTPFNANPAIIISRMFPIPRLKSIHAFTTSTNLVSGSRWIP